MVSENIERLIWGRGIVNAGVRGGSCAVYFNTRPGSRWIETAGWHYKLTKHGTNTIAGKRATETRRTKLKTFATSDSVMLGANAKNQSWQTRSNAIRRRENMWKRKVKHLATWINTQVLLPMRQNIGNEENSLLMESVVNIISRFTITVGNSKIILFETVSVLFNRPIQKSATWKRVKNPVINSSL